MSYEDQIKSFGMTNMLIESDLERIESQFSLKFRQTQKDEDKSNEIENAYFLNSKNL